MPIKWLRKALKSLEQAYQVAAAEDVDAAVQLVLRIQATVEQLEHFPQLGRVGRLEGKRELVIANTPFIVVDRVKGRTVEILRVLHLVETVPGLSCTSGRGQCSRQSERRKRALWRSHRRTFAARSFQKRLNAGVEIITVPQLAPHTSLTTTARCDSDRVKRPNGQRWYCSVSLDLSTIAEAALRSSGDCRRIRSLSRPLRSSHCWSRP